MHKINKLQITSSCFLKSLKNQYTALALKINDFLECLISFRDLWRKWRPRTKKPYTRSFALFISGFLRYWLIMTIKNAWANNDTQTDFIAKWITMHQIPGKIIYVLFNQITSVAKQKGRFLQMKSLICI